MHMDDAYFAPSTVRVSCELKKIFDRILHKLQCTHITLHWVWDQLDRIFEYRAGSSYSFPVTNIELEYMFDILGFLWLHHDSTPYLLYLLEKLVDGLSDERMRPPHYAQLLQLYKKSRLVSINHSSWNRQLLWMCDGNFKSKNIRVHGNATIIKQTGRKLVYSVEQRKASELMAIVEEKCPIAQRDGLKKLEGEKAPFQCKLDE